MSKASIWMVRAGQNAVFANDFVEHGFVGIGFASAGHVTLPIDKSYLESQVSKNSPELGEAKVSNIASQVKRFYDELSIGDSVMTYDSSERLYYIGTIDSEVVEKEHVLGRARRVKWTKVVHRDSLSQATRNTLGAIQSLFLVRDRASEEVWQRAVLIGDPVDPEPAIADVVPPRQLDESVQEIEEKAFELIDDVIASLKWDELQELIAEILRAMGFRAETSEKGPDRGVDVIASPDGLGLLEPRIFVEVKHRKGTRISADQIRAFLGGRQQGDRCLYVSTGGYTKESRYEAERSSIPVTLIDLPKLRSLVLEHYENFTPAGRDLVPLQRVFWPIG